MPYCYSSSCSNHIDDTAILFKQVYDRMKPDGVFVMGDMVTEDDSFHAPVIVPHNGFDVDEIMQVAKTQEFKYVKAYVHDSMCKNERDYPLFIFIAFKN